MELNNIYNTDALEGLKQLDENSIDAIISDPPYQLTSITRSRPDQTEDGEYGREVPFSRVQSRVKSGFMNKSWDVLPSADILKECLRVLKTGAWALWLMTPRQDSQLEFLLRLRQAGFNISFSEISWIYLSGFPKAADLSLLADKRACREDAIQKLGREPTKDEFKEAWSKWREVVGKRTDGRYAYSFQKENAPFVVMNKEKGIIANTESIGVETNPHTQEAQDLSGSYAGMQLKPARELIIVSQKPIAGKTYLDQALLHLKEPEHNQLGGTWLDDCRIPFKQADEPEGGYGRMGIGIGKPAEHQHYTKRQPRGSTDWGLNSGFKSETNNIAEANPNGRFPANIIVSDNALDIGMKHSIGHIPMQTKGISGKHIYGKYSPIQRAEDSYLNDSGDLSRYFDLDFWFENKLKELPEEQQKIFPFLYVPKASKGERNAGLEDMPEGKVEALHGNMDGSLNKRTNGEPSKAANVHPTVKPLKLMSYLITLATREGDTVLDPFTGSGTTGIASIKLNRNFIGFERETDYFKIAEARINEATQQKKLGQ